MKKKKDIQLFLISNCKGHNTPAANAYTLKLYIGQMGRIFNLRLGGHLIKCYLASNG